MAEEETRMLVEKYAPIIHFHPEEGDFCCYPSDAEEVYSKFHSRWDAFSKDLTPRTLDQQTPCFYEIWEDKAFIQIRYWIWYNYNRFPKAPFGLGDHLGDWEHVEVRIYQDHGTLWLLSNHLDYRLAAKPLNLSLSGRNPHQALLDGNHIHVWSALGSHAHYASPNSNPRCYAKILCDKIEDGGAIWKTWNSLIPVNETNFASFTGRWGDKGSPRSPLNSYNNRWRNAPSIIPEYRE